MAGLKFILTGLTVLVLAACQTAPMADSGTAFLVRHAEKVTGDGVMKIDDPRDPPLTQAGQARAEALADRLESAGITQIWSTDTIRTRNTASPLAARLGVSVMLYDASDLAGFAAQIRANSDGNIVVVGHSNTTPQLAAALGAESGDPIVEATEYDRLYVIDLATGAGEIERYGVASVIPD